MERNKNMKDSLRADAEWIVRSAIELVSPARAVKQALQNRRFPGRVYLVAVGKAAWEMARAALEVLPTPVSAGIVVTKYGHVFGSLPGIECREAGHPVPDANTLRATERALELTMSLTEEDTVLFLLSGGGSALFEKPLVSLEELQDITSQLLACGANIQEINTIRKRLSAVKGGRFALHCAPARVETILLSDILGDPLDQIASGPTIPDGTSCAEAAAVSEKYHLRLSAAARRCLDQETPKNLVNTAAQVVGSVGQLCQAAADCCRRRGYKPLLLTDCLDCEAREAGRFLASIARTQIAACSGQKLALLAGGETVVHLHGKGLGGRNQELALAAAPGLSGLKGAAVISVGSDGTDGPTDAAGGYADGETLRRLAAKQWSVDAALANNDAYHALQAVDGLVITGPTGTNVNDIAVVLLDGTDS